MRAGKELGVFLLLPRQGGGRGEDGAPFHGVVQGHAGAVHVQSSLGAHRDFHLNIGRRHCGLCVAVRGRRAQDDP
eukprot:scaffold143386_cov133-Phaeocystis_antarctica.AAC.1